MFMQLLFAHLLADFPLQPRWLVAAKDRLWALGFHAGIHFLTALLMVGSARVKLLLPVAALGLVHFAIDFTKYRVGAIRPEWVKLPYLIDQAVHLLSLLLISRWMVGILAPANPVETPAWLIYGIGYLAATHVWFVTEKMLTEPQSSYRKEVEAELWPRMVARGVLLTILLLTGSGFGPLGLAATIWLPYSNRSHRARAVLTDLAVATLVAGMVKWATLSILTGI